MKVYLSKPRYHWVSPYTVLEKVLFWLDWDNISYDTPWVEKWSNRILPLSKAYQKIMDKIHPKIDYVKIDYWDVWSMDHTLSPIVLPMLKQLKSVKHGSPNVDDEDVPLELRSYACMPKENDWDTDDNWHKRWEYVLDEMIWAFEQLNDDDHEEQFWKERGEVDWDAMRKPFTEGETSREMKWIKPSVVDWEGMKAHNARIDNGCRLFGKYYRALWD